VAEHPDLLVGTETGDDAAVYRVGEDRALVFTADFFAPIVDDPFAYGAIAVANALSDIYAMGGRPTLGLNLVGFPRSLPHEILIDILKGGQAKAREAGCLLVGGHTVDDPEPKYGLAAIGFVQPSKIMTNAGARPGDRLVLTKPLGTGIITTAAKEGVVEARAPLLEQAIAVMSTLNRAASEAMMEAEAHACTDVTGFGLLGHLREMVEGSNVSASLCLSKIPVIPGTRELIARGIAPQGTHRNLESVKSVVRWDSGITEVDQLLLCDAQTSGGLLIAVPHERLEPLLSNLNAVGVEWAAIGEIKGDGRRRIEVRA
jgi:selenide,water dikinase